MQKIVLPQAPPRAQQVAQARRAVRLHGVDLSQEDLRSRQCVVERVVFGVHRQSCAFGERAQLQRGFLVGAVDEALVGSAMPGAPCR
jgi:hypothetical protein